MSELTIEVPPASEIRERLSANLREREMLRSLLKVRVKVDRANADGPTAPRRESRELTSASCR